MRAGALKTVLKLPATFAVLLVLFSSSLSAHRDLYGGRPWTDPETGYTFVDPDGMRTLDWTADNISSVKVADNDLQAGRLFVTWSGLGRVKEIDGRKCLEGGLFLFDYNDKILFNTDVRATVRVLVDKEHTDAFFLRYDHSVSGPVDIEVTVDQKGERWQWVEIPIDHARFANRMYGNTDLSIVARANVYPPDTNFLTEVVIADIEVRIDHKYPPPEAGTGKLSLSIKDDHTGTVTHARIGLYNNKTGRAPLVSEDALLLYINNVKHRMTNLRSGKDEGNSWPGKGPFIFWANGRYTAEVPAGEYQLVVAKGPEYHIENRIIKVAAGKTTEVEVNLKRWRNLAAEGWYSSDNHVHVDRYNQEDNRELAAMMKAEDVKVVVDLQIMYDQLFVFHQLYGDEGNYRDGNSMIVDGQETPRGSQWGHTGSWPVSEFHRPDNYLAYHEVWPAIKADPANPVTGMHHTMLNLFGAKKGLAMNMPLGDIDFIEFLQGSIMGPEIFYDWLNLGYRVSPSAGTDYPTFSHAGQERTYTYVDSELTRDSWKEAFRAGRSFVSNGPILDLSVNGKGMGDELNIKPGTPVQVIARATMNPDWDKLERLELIVHGEVVDTVEVKDGAETLTLSKTLRPQKGMWVAVRAWGKTYGKAHSGPVYVLVDGREGFWSEQKAEAIVEDYKKELREAFETMSIEDLRIWATGGRLPQAWKEALPSNRARAQAAMEALDARLDLIRRSRVSLQP